jgi:hypothetical protein
VWGRFNAACPSVDSGVRIADRPEGEIEIVIARGAAEIRGMVAGANGDGVADATVVLVPERRNRRDLYKIALSDASGRFALAGVAPGAYRAFAWEEDVPTGSWFSAEFLQGHEDRGTPITVNEGGLAEVAVRVIPIR